MIHTQDEIEVIFLALSGTFQEHQLLKCCYYFLERHIDYYY